MALVCDYTTTSVDVVDRLDTSAIRPIAASARGKMIGARGELSGTRRELLGAKDLNEVKEKIKRVEKETEYISVELEGTRKTLEEVIETRNTLMKVVESVSSYGEVKKLKKNKIKIQCREFDKPNGCQWAEQCRFLHGVKKRLEKTKDCSYWLDGECCFPDKVCWNKHDPAKKGRKSVEESASSQLVFQEGQQDQRLPPGQQSASRMDAGGWREPSRRRKKRRTTVIAQEKERQVKSTPQVTDGETAPACLQFKQPNHSQWMEGQTNRSCYMSSRRSCSRFP